MSVDQIAHDTEALSLLDHPRLSVLDDYDHIGAELLKSANEECLEFKCVHWDIEMWWDLPDRVEGPKFEAGGHQWNMVLFPNGGVAESFVSIYLKWVNTSNDPYRKCARAQFAVCLSTPSQPTNYLGYGTEHIFTSGHDDWGFAHIMEIDCIDQKDWGTGLDPLLEDSKIRVSVMIRVFENNDDIACPSTSTAYHPTDNTFDPSSSTSQYMNSVDRATGFVGIKSMDDTGSLSILLQLLYFTGYFRRSCYEIADIDSCDALTALLGIFTQLQTLSSTVEIAEFVGSLGWDYEDLLIQRDVIQFKQTLQSALELKCPALSPLYQRTFGIKYSGNDKYEYALSLNIDGYSDLQGALFDHVFSDCMMIEKLPPVLHIHLKRFWYNADEEYVEKMNDRLEYSLEIDLDPFVESFNDRSESHIYVLQSVIVHDENLNTGMYYAYIRPTCEGSNWIKIQDDKVTPSSKDDALENSYGGILPPDDLYAASCTHNAYMLSYVRKSRLQEILYQTPANDHHPSNTTSTGDRPRPPKMFTDYEVSIITDASFRANRNSFDLFDLNHHSLRKISVDKTTATLSTLEAAVSEQVGISPENFRLWMICERYNNTIRPDEIVGSQTKKEELVGEYITQCAKLGDQSYMMYLETPISPQLSPSQILLFIKYFDIEVQSVQGVGHIVVDANDQVESISGIINALVGTPIDMQLDIYEEIKPGMIDRLHDTMTFRDSELQHGDIICAQRHLSDEEKSEMLGLFLNVDCFYAALL
ncbi:hypothetical protein BJV82DRAFT_587918 [Fennellomyces sp. T-0311]|nr:hypothetical protein BJV82DRAFT_587918 [Fennellomyces sp. T-0311]